MLGTPARFWILADTQKANRNHRIPMSALKESDIFMHYSFVGNKEKVLDESQ